MVTQSIDWCRSYLFFFLGEKGGGGRAGGGGGEGRTAISTDSRTIYTKSRQSPRQQDR